jgi:peptidoglycan/LPS O-acetylase OafA/YrhL
MPFWGCSVIITPAISQAVIIITALILLVGAAYLVVVFYDMPLRKIFKR